MRLELHYRSDLDLSQPAMQVEIRNHIARYLRDYPDGDEGMITLAGVEHCFMYVVHDDVVDTVIGPREYIEQVANERRQTAMKREPRWRARNTTNPYSGHRRSPKPSRTSLLRSPPLPRYGGSALGLT